MVFNMRKALVCMLTIVIAPSGAIAHETDQYTVPESRVFADLGPYYTQVYYNKITSAVAKVNARIEAARRRGASNAEMRRLQSPATIATAVLFEVTPVAVMVEMEELSLHAAAMQERYPGLIVAYRPWSWIYDNWALVLDITKLMRQKRISTVMVNGTYLGTDKFAHFIHVGYLYYCNYRNGIAHGLTEEEASQRAAGLGVGVTSFLSEDGLLGMFLTGIRSNADLTANYAGMLFFRNLTEEVRLHGKMRGPMLVRHGDLWKLSDRVGPHTDFFVLFVSDHWDEALNPCVFDILTDALIRTSVKARCPRLLYWYRDVNGEPRTRRQFLDIQEKLATYFGEPYDRAGSIDKMVSIANCCFPEDDAADVPPDLALFRAAEAGDIDGMQRAIDAGARINARREADAGPRGTAGATPLHAAAARGQVDAIAFLLDRGAAPNARTERGVSPLHKAVSWSQAAERLIDGGADIDATDELGRTPLHWAIRAAADDTFDLLVDRGASLEIADVDGDRPLHCAARRGDVTAVRALLQHDAEVDAVAMYGIRPLHLAARRGEERIVELLLDQGAAVDARDDFGCTALHDAAAYDRREVAVVLVERGANADAKDEHGTTPLHRAARAGHVAVAAVLLDSGADARLANAFGHTPQDEARFGRNPRLLKMLEQAHQREEDKAAAVAFRHSD